MKWSEERYEWVRMPSWWIHDNYDKSLLKAFDVRDKGGSIAALMLYIMLCARANQKATEDFKVGTARVTYDDICNATGMSRAMVSTGIDKLTSFGLISPVSYRKQNIYELIGHDEAPWAKLPKKHLYRGNKNGKIPVFIEDFNLRSKNELNAIKLYCLLLAFRNNDTNTVHIGYESITEYSGIIGTEIRRAISFFISWKSGCA